MYKVTDYTDRIRIGCETVKPELLFKEMLNLVLGIGN